MPSNSSSSVLEVRPWTEQPFSHNFFPGDAAASGQSQKSGRISEAPPPGGLNENRPNFFVSR